MSLHITRGDSDSVCLTARFTRFRIGIGWFRGYPGPGWFYAGHTGTGTVSIRVGKLAIQWRKEPSV